GGGGGVAAGWWPGPHPSPGSPASPSGPRVRVQPPLPAGIVPVTAVGRIATVGRPGDQVSGARGNFLVAAGAAVGLGAGRPGHQAGHPVPVRRRFSAFGPQSQSGTRRLSLPALRTRPARAPRPAAL